LRSLKKYSHDSISFNIWGIVRADQVEEQIHVPKQLIAQIDPDFILTIPDKYMGELRE
jgi:hypothetical protein